MDTDDAKDIFKKAVNSVSPGWMSFCGGIGLLALILAISCRIMDFNPGPLWEKSIELSMEIRRTDNEMKIKAVEMENENAIRIQSFEARLKEVEFLSHEQGK